MSFIMAKHECARRGMEMTNWNDEDDAWPEENLQLEEWKGGLSTSSIFFSLFLFL